MTEEKIQEISKALSGLSYREWIELSQMVSACYTQIKKSLTSEEIKLLARRIH